MNISELAEFAPKEINLIDPDHQIYFLTKDDGEVVYIGKTKNIMQRLSTHLCKEKDFDKAYMIDIDDWTMEQVEAAFIQYARPMYNKTVTKINYGVHPDHHSIINFFVKDEFEIPNFMDVMNSL